MRTLQNHWFEASGIAVIFLILAFVPMPPTLWVAGIILLLVFGMFSFWGDAPDDEPYLIAHIDGDRLDEHIRDCPLCGYEHPHPERWHHIGDYTGWSHRQA